MRKTDRIRPRQIAPRIRREPASPVESSREIKLAVFTPACNSATLNGRPMRNDLMPPTARPQNTRKAAVPENTENHGTRHKEMTIEQVQHWVVSLLIFAITSFPMGALIVASNVYYRQGNVTSAFGLCIMCGVVGVCAVVAMHLVHGRSVMSPYLPLGLLPAVGAAIAMWNS